MKQSPRPYNYRAAFALAAFALFALVLLAALIAPGASPLLPTLPSPLYITLWALKGS